MATEKSDHRSVVHASRRNLVRYPVTYEVDVSVFGCPIRIQCWNEYLHSFLTANYGSCHGSGKGIRRLTYFIKRTRHSNGFTLMRNGVNGWFVRDEGEILARIQTDVMNHLQSRRSDLYFLRAASLELGGCAFVLVAPPGTGKSTLIWGLLHEGFAYMSGEYTAIRLKSMKVYPFPQAICLKSKPPAPYNLPKQTFCTSGAIGVPVTSLPNRSHRAPNPLTAMLFLDRDGRNCPSAIMPMSKAEAAARLYENSFNSFVPKREGLDAAIKIATSTVCLRLVLGDLSAACALVKGFASRFESIVSGSRQHDKCRSLVLKHASLG